MKGGSNAKRGQDSSNGLRGAFDVWYVDRGSDSGRGSVGEVRLSEAWE